LKSNDYFFCSSCGKELPEDLVRTELPVKTRVYVPDSGKKKAAGGKSPVKDLFNRKTVFGLLGVVVLFGLTFFAITSGEPLIARFTKNGKGDDTTGAVSPPPSPDEPLILRLNLPLSSGQFGYGQLPEYVPGDVDVYVEVRDLDLFIQDYAAKDVLDSDLLNVADNVLEDYFAVFGVGTSGPTKWTYIFTPKDTEIVRALIKDFEDEYWDLEMVSDKVILSTDEEVFQKIEDVRRGAIMNLTLNPLYVKETAKLPKIGKILVVYMTDDGRNIMNELFYYPSVAKGAEKIVNFGRDAFVIE